MDVSPDSYEKASSLHTRDGVDLLKRIPESVLSRPGITVLEIGCGPGNLTCSILRKLPRNGLLIAVDVDPLMVERCRSQTSKHFPDHHIRPLVQDFGVPFKMLSSEITDLEGKVDLIISNYALHWILPQDRSNAINSIKKLLCPGGRVYINVSLLPDLLGVCNSSEEREQLQSVLNIPSFQMQEQTWKHEFETANFSKLQVACLPLSWTFETRQEFMLLMKIRKVFMVHVKHSYPKDVDLNDIFMLIERLCIRYQTQCHERAVGKLSTPDEVRSVYYRCVMIIATK